MKQIYLLTIDPQRDFCDEDGALSVPGADKDMIRLAGFLTKNQKAITEIRVTMDCHQMLHIAHPIYWVNAKGEHPEKFSVMTPERVASEGWKPFHPDLVGWTNQYLADLRKNGRYDLRIWPPHCIFGTKGWTVVPQLMDAFIAWEQNNINRIQWHEKGNNFLTEQYSAVVADVPDPADESTALNRELIHDLEEADEVLVAGEALSHCLGGTLWDISQNGGNMKRYTLLTDCTSNVAGCESLGNEYIKKLVALGMKTATTETWRV